MPETEENREEALRQLLTDAIEVQLAALKAGINFWSEWIEQTTTFVDSATKSLASINQDDPKTKDVLLELVDAGRASVRGMTEIPRHTALKFIEELDRFEEKKQKQQPAKAAAGEGSAKTAGSKPAPAKRAAAKRGAASNPRRATRVKD